MGLAGVQRGHRRGMAADILSPKLGGWGEIFAAEKAGLLKTADHPGRDSR